MFGGWGHYLLTKAEKLHRMAHELSMDPSGLDETGKDVVDRAGVSRHSNRVTNEDWFTIVRAFFVRINHYVWIRTQVLTLLPSSFVGNHDS